jgi:hypothetical protein
VTYRAEDVKNPYAEYEENYLSNDAPHFAARFAEMFRDFARIPTTSVEKYLLKSLNVRGSIADVAYIDFEDGGRRPLKVQFHDDLDFETIEICMSLGLIAREVLSFKQKFELKNGYYFGMLNIAYFRVTLLGHGMIKLCDPDVLSKLDGPSKSGA